LHQADAIFRTVLHGQTRLGLEAFRHLGGKNDAVPVVVAVEELRGEGIAPTMTGTAWRIQHDPHGA
jgi:hypothetical protein